MARQYSLNEVSAHGSAGDLWVASRGKVYDVTGFVGRHPGGSDVLLEHGGLDVTQLMEDRGPHSHSKAAYVMLEQYCIGELAGDTHHRTTQGHADSVNSEQSSGEEVKSKVLHDRMDTNQDDFEIDVRKPMVWQIGKLGKCYQSWIHSPIDQDLRFFESDLLESLTMCQWYVVPSVWVPIMLLFICLSYNNFLEAGSEIWMPWLMGGVSLTAWCMPVMFVAGVLLWTLMEYVIHRWVFHLNPPHWSRVLITLHFLFHGQHHKNPMNKDRLVFPPVPASFFAFVIYHVYMSLLPRAAAQCIIAGTVVGYIAYDLIHYYLHHGSPSTGYFRNLKNYHINHHYVEQQKGFGISSKLWDYPFSTLSTNEHSKKNEDDVKAR